MVDTKQDGLVSKRELQKFIKENLKDNKDSEKIANAILEYGDDDKDGNLTFKEWVGAIGDIEAHHGINVVTVLNKSVKSENA